MSLRSGGLRDFDDSEDFKGDKLENKLGKNAKIGGHIKTSSGRVKYALPQSVASNHKVQTTTVKKMSEPKSNLSSSRNFFIFKIIIGILLILVTGYVIFISPVHAQLYVCQNDLTMYSSGILFYGMNFQQMENYCQFGEMLYYGSWFFLIVGIALLFVKNKGITTLLSVIGIIYLIIMLGSTGLILLQNPSSGTNTSLVNNNATNPQQIPSSQSKNLMSGLVSYYKLDETTGTVAMDSLWANNGFIDKGIVNQSGKIGNAYLFDGISGKVTTGITGWSTAAGSISFWYKPVTMVAWGGLFDTTQNANTPGALRITYYPPDTSKFYITVGGDAVNSLIVSHGMDINTWTHLVLTWDNQNVKLYINGNNMGSFTTTQQIVINQFVMGRTWAAYSEVFSNGYMDEVGVWNRALTDTEVSSLYNLGNGWTYSPTQ